MHRTNIYLDEAQRDALDRLAAEEGTTRAELIRRVLDRWLRGGHHDAIQDLDAIDASFGALAHLDVPERGVDERSRHLERVWRAGT